MVGGDGEAASFRYRTRSAGQGPATFSYGLDSVGVAGAERSSGRLEKGIRRFFVKKNLTSLKGRYTICVWPDNGGAIHVGRHFSTQPAGSEGRPLVGLEGVEFMFRSATGTQKTRGEGVTGYLCALAAKRGCSPVGKDPLRPVTCASPTIRTDAGICPAQPESEYRRAPQTEKRLTWN